MVRVMSRSIHATTASGDEVRLEARAQMAARGRTVAQLEHNAMQALALVRAALTALDPMLVRLDRVTLLLSHSRGLVEAAVKPELKRSFSELVEHVQNAAYGGELLLCGGVRAFAVEDPWSESAELPLTVVQLPELSECTRALSQLDLHGGVNALALGQRNTHALQSVRKAQRQLQQLAKQLADVLATRRRGAARSSQPLPKRAGEDGFVDMVSHLRDQVLAAGPTALRVQGSPTTRAAWLVEGTQQAG